MSKNTNTRLANFACRECKFYRGLYHTYLNHDGDLRETRTNERCTRKAQASLKAKAAFFGGPVPCFKPKAA